MDNPSSSMTVSADAQFTVARVLRPFKGFAAQYQNQSATIPVAFPGTLDPDAGKPGFSPYLLKGIPVPYGGKVSLWFPMLSGSLGEATPFGYVYLLHWRMRSVADFVRRMTANGEPLPYHLAKGGEGAPDTLLAPVPPERFVIPSGTETVLYQRAEPAGIPAAPGIGVGNLRTEVVAIPDDDLVNTSTTAGLPLLPPGVAPPYAAAYPGASTGPFGLFQQGILDPSDSLTAGSSIFRPYFTVAKGDELIITVVRDPAQEIPSPNVWNFTSGGSDEEFGLFYGSASPDFGVYVLTGTNPS